MTALIYEKRYGGNGIGDRSAYNPVHVKTEQGTGVPERGICCAAPEQKPKAVRRKSCTNRRKTRRNSRPCKKPVSVFLAVCIAAVVFCADAKFFESALFERVVSVTRAAVTVMLENQSEPQTYKSIPRTIYTLDYAEDVRTDSAFENQTPENADDGEEELRRTSVSASPAVQGYADGVRLLPITEMDLSCNSILNLANETDYSPDMQSLLQMRPSALDVAGETDGPLVLILHTHACESYTQYEGAYPEDEETRTEDTAKNVVAVGAQICRTLSDFGVSAVHCTRLHDSESFINAYGNSAASVKEYLREFPTIRFVIDVHRDAVIRDDGESIKPIADISGEKYAQLMFVVGTNRMGHNHPMWEDNLSLALTLQESIDSTYPSLCRSINLRNVPFNQQLSSGYLLLEVGTSANTLDEALRSARAFGENLARVILTV